MVDADCNKSGLGGMTDCHVAQSKDKTGVTGETTAIGNSLRGAETRSFVDLNQFNFLFEVMDPHLIYPDFCDVTRAVQTNIFYMM